MKKRTYISDINITPFVDVMLVLLVIFLVTAPVVMSQIPVSLPKNAHKNSLSNKKPIFVTLTSSGQIFANDIKTHNISDLKVKLEQLGATVEDTIYIRGDKEVSYGNVMNLMNQLNKMHFKVSLVTENE